MDIDITSSRFEIHVSIVYKYGAYEPFWNDKKIRIPCIGIEEDCAFDWDGVWLGFSNWKGNEGLLEKSGWSYKDDKGGYYIHVCDDKQTMLDSKKLEQKLAGYVNKYLDVYKKISG